MFRTSTRLHLNLCQCALHADSYRTLLIFINLSRERFAFPQLHLCYSIKILFYQDIDQFFCKSQWKAEHLQAEESGMRRSDDEGGIQKCLEKLVRCTADQLLVRNPPSANRFRRTASDNTYAPYVPMDAPGSRIECKTFEKYISGADTI